MHALPPPTDARARSNTGCLRHHAPRSRTNGQLKVFSADLEVSSRRPRSV